MKKALKSFLASALAFLALLNSAGLSAYADFNEYGNHWYYSDDQSFKYWGLTEVNDYGIPVDSQMLSNISFNGATPQNIYKAGITSYAITATVYNVPTTVNVNIALRGDADYNDTMDLYDAIFIASTMIGIQSFSTDFHEFTCDYNTDGSVDLYDVIDMCKTIMQTSISEQIVVEQKRMEYINEVCRLVNIERVNAGLSELTLDASLCTAAQVRAEEIASQDDNISHTRPDGSSCFTVLQEMNIFYYYTGENIAAGYISPAAVVEGWMNSEGHRENILDPNYNKLGVGYCYKEGTYYQNYWSQFFIQD